MKNKKAEQANDRKRHRETLRKVRSTENPLVRKVPFRVEKPTILIVCEGENTEPSYFNQFKLTSATVKPIGEGYNTLSLVKRARTLVERAEAKGKSFDQIWCVFDADPKPDNPKQAQNFNEAVRMATELGYGAAYSNQAFEYWLILHLNDHQGGAIDRDDYHKMLNDLLKPFGVTYNGKKDKVVSENFFNVLDGIDEFTGNERVSLAIERAKRNYGFFDHKNLADEQSSTTVFRLVEEMIKYV